MNQLLNNPGIVLIINNDNDLTKYIIDNIKLNNKDTEVLDVRFIVNIDNFYRRPILMIKNINRGEPITLDQLNIPYKLKMRSNIIILTDNGKIFVFKNKNNYIIDDMGYSKIKDRLSKIDKLLNY